MSVELIETFLLAKKFERTGRQLCLLALTLAFPLQALADSPGWITEQQGQLVRNSRFAVTAKGFRTDSVDAGYSVIAEAPLWKIYAISDRSKLYFPMVSANGTNVASGGTSLLRAAVVPNSVESVWQQWKKTTYLGHPMLVWHTVPKNRLRARDYRTMEVWTAAEIPISPAMSKFGTDINGYPKESRLLPVRCLIIHADDVKEQVMEAKSIKPAMLKDSLFKVPKGYKLARNEMEVVMNTKDLGDILEGFGR